MNLFRYILLSVVTLVFLTCVISSCLNQVESKSANNQYDNQIIPRSNPEINKTLVAAPKPISKSTWVPSNKIASKQPRFQNKIKRKNKKVSRLIKNMNKVGLNGEIFKHWFKEGEPSTVHYWEDGKLNVVKGNGGSGKGIDKTLYLSDEFSIQEIIKEREAESESIGDFYESQQNDSHLLRLGHDAYKVVSFTPGVSDNRSDYVKKPNNINYSVTGPDHNFDPIDKDDPDRDKKLIRLREKTVTLGHGGEIVLKIKKGQLRNHDGFDFIVYENPFRVKDEFLGSLGIPLIYQEFARVGVSQTRNPKSFRWFPCDPLIGEISGCAGVVPTDEGGDKFDLSSLGLAWIKYIKIKDTGNNFNNLGKDTEGFDLDALKLIYPYSY